MRKLLTRGNLLYALFMLVVLLVTGEIGARWYLSKVLQKSPQRKFQFDPYRVYSHVPGFQESDEQGVRLSINKQGFRRTTDLVIPKPANTYRIFFMGGSAAHGISSAAPFPIAHVRDNETVDAYLEAMLNERFPGMNVEVVNAAVTGYQVFQHTHYLISEILDMEPDMVIFMDGYNDHFKFDPEENLHRDFPYNFWGPRLQEPDLPGGFDYAALWASDFSGLARGYYAWRNERDAMKKIGASSARLGSWKADQIIAGYRSVRTKGYLEAIANNIALLQAHQVKALISLQPGLIFRDRTAMDGVERDTLMPIIEKNDWRRVAVMPLILADLDSLTSLAGVPFVDLNPGMNAPALAGQQLFLDYCHLTALGGKAVAQGLFPVVVQAMAEKPSFGTEEPNTALNDGLDP